MKEKSVWFYSEDTAQTKAVVMLAHGLNLHPKKMDDLARFFSFSHCDVLRISLGADPSKWEEKFAKDYEKVFEQSKLLGLPLYFVGYSLGALVGLHFMMNTRDHQFQKMALFAPATHTRAFTKLTSLLAFLFPGGSLPSLNLKEYRERNFTSLAEYKKMHQLQKELKKADHFIPSIVFQSRADELIHSQNLEKFAGTKPDWKVVFISNQTSQFPRGYHHLIIDGLSVGKAEWEKILKNLSAYFDL